MAFVRAEMWGKKSSKFNFFKKFPYPLPRRRSEWPDSMLEMRKLDTQATPGSAKQPLYAKKPLHTEKALHSTRVAALNCSFGQLGPLRQ
jgi:hypothetical protein